VNDIHLYVSIIVFCNESYIDFPKSILEIDVHFQYEMCPNYHNNWTKYLQKPGKLCQDPVAMEVSMQVDEVNLIIVPCF
jgi:hypothetical protein